MNTEFVNTLDEWLKRMPIIAILRGVEANEVVSIGQALLEAGIGVIEVPLNSPQPLLSIERLCDSLGDSCILGAGTVLKPTQVEDVVRAGGQIIVSPNTDPNVILRSLELGVVPMPGWASTSEAFQAYSLGAKYLKLFPAASYGPGHIKACLAVLPSDIKLLAVGGIGAADAAPWLRAGIAGFGIGTELYTPGCDAKKVFTQATKIVTSIHQARTLTKH